LIPELLELNGVQNRKSSFHIRYEYEESDVLTSWWRVTRRS